MRVTAGDRAHRRRRFEPASAERRQAGDLDRLIQVVNRMLDEIERLMREVKGVTDDIAHDLRTPLTRLLAGLERARRRAPRRPRTMRPRSTRRLSRSRGILATFSALLRIAEVESGARRAGFRAVDLNDGGSRCHGAVRAGSPRTRESRCRSRAAQRPAPEMPETPACCSRPSAIWSTMRSSTRRRASRVAVRVLATTGSRHRGQRYRPRHPRGPSGARCCDASTASRNAATRPGSGLGLSLVAAVARLHDLHLAIEDAHPGCRIVLWREEPAPSAPEPAVIKLG